MRTARTHGVKKDGAEELIFGSDVEIPKQLQQFADWAAKGIPDKYVRVDYQTSDGAVRTLRNGISANLKSVEERLKDKQDNAKSWKEKQKKAAKEREEAEAKERQERIDKANAAKEAAKKALGFPVASKGK